MYSSTRNRTRTVRYTRTPLKLLPSTQYGQKVLPAKVLLVERCSSVLNVLSGLFMSKHLTRPPYCALLGATTLPHKIYGQALIVRQLQKSSTRTGLLISNQLNLRFICRSSEYSGHITSTHNTISRVHAVASALAISALAFARVYTPRPSVAATKVSELAS